MGIHDTTGSIPSLSGYVNLLAFVFWIDEDGWECANLDKGVRLCQSWKLYGP